MAKVWTSLKNKQLVHDAHGSTRFNNFARDLLDKTDSEILHGLERCKDFTGFFNTPAFRELCKPDPEALGLPALELAFTQACQATTSTKNRLHPAVYHAAADTGWFDLRNGSARRSVFASHYNRRVKQIMDGEVLEIPKMDLIEKKSPPPLAADVIKSRCAELQKLFA